MTLYGKAGERMEQIKGMLVGKSQDPNSIPWDPTCTSFPLRKDLPKLPGCPEEAAWVWGKDDYCGRLNLLTPARVKAAAAEIKTGEMAPLDLPTNVPVQPAFGREAFKQEIKTLVEGVCYDDIYHMNTQTGTQWDGFRHFAHPATQTFFNNTKPSDITGPNPTGKCSIHHWREHGFTGRGVLLDYRSYADSKGIKYDSATSHEITWNELVECGRFQGLDIRPESQGGDMKIGDILMIRSGWTEDYYRRTPEENKAIGLRKSSLENDQTCFVGVKREQAVLDWLHDCYFAAVGGDAPGFEVFPFQGDWFLHQYILALWGMPLGEMVDLEKVAELAKKHKRYTFFFTSAPFRTPGGVSSYLNATAIF